MKINDHDVNIYKIINSHQIKVKLNSLMQIGQTLTMELVQKEGEQGTLKFHGEEIRAFLKMDDNGILPLGSKVSVRVEGFQNQQVVLKLVDSPAQPLKQQLVQDMDHALMENGFMPTEENVNVVEKLLQYQLPVNKENIDKIFQGMQLFLPDREIGMNTALFLMSRGLPFHPTLFQLVADYQQHNMPLGQHIEKFLQQISIHLNGQHIGNTWQKEMNLQKIADILEKWPVSLQEVGNGVSVENDDMTQLVNKLRGLFGNGLRLGSEKSGQGLTEVLREAALNLMDEWPSGMKEVIQQITTQPLLNHRAEQVLPYIYYQIPIKYNGKLETGELFILPEKRNKKDLSKEQMHLVFCLDTYELGLLKIDIRVENNILQAVIGVENEEIRRFVKSRIYLLEQGLKKLEYGIKSIECNIDIQKPFAYIDRLQDVSLDKFDIII